jgi:hypothetical protein
MKIVKDKIAISEIRRMAKKGFGSLVKAAVDVEKEIMAIDGELHADEEALLITHGSKQRNLWGINLYPELPESERVEFDSVINLRPASGNKSRGVDDRKLRKKIIEIVDKLIKS